MAALVDLYFAEERDKKRFRCSGCKAQKDRRCGERGFENLSRKPMKVGEGSLAYPFCPGKATWYAEITELFEPCRVALETGIMPKRGSMEDQPELFVTVFPVFLERWRDRHYQRVWQDVWHAVKTVLNSVFGKGKGK